MFARIPSPDAPSSTPSSVPKESPREEHMVYRPLIIRRLICMKNPSPVLADGVVKNSINSFLQFYLLSGAWYQ